VLKETSRLLGFGHYWCEPPSRVSDFGIRIVPDFGFRAVGSEGFGFWIWVAGFGFPVLASTLLVLRVLGFRVSDSWLRVAVQISGAQV
jgi:hypothetical protein